MNCTKILEIESKINGVCIHVRSTVLRLKHNIHSIVSLKSNLTCLYLNWRSCTVDGAKLLLEHIALINNLCNPSLISDTFISDTRQLSETPVISSYAKVVAAFSLNDYGYTGTVGSFTFAEYEHSTYQKMFCSIEVIIKLLDCAKQRILCLRYK